MMYVRAMLVLVFALAVVSACNGDGTSPPTTGTIEVIAATMGSELDPDGYTVTVDGEADQALGVNSSISISGLSAGDHTVELTDVAANCSVGGSNPRTATVSAGSTATTTFDVSCAVTTGAIHVTSSTTGSTLDPDDYTVSVDGGAGQSIAINGSATFTGVPAGDREVELTDVAANCTVAGANPRTVAVAAGGTASTSFDVACALIAPVDFTTFAVESYPPAASFPAPTWTLTAATATPNGNGDASVLYSPSSALNMRFMGSFTPGSDDDVVGFVLGFSPGDAQIASSADYLLIDWKGETQTFDFADGDPGNLFHDLTTEGEMSVGLALSRVTGSPTADELWQHIDDSNNPDGGVTQLARGTTLGATPYDRAGGSHTFDITYTSSRVTVIVDGVTQLDVSGSFTDGRFGLYSAWQGPSPAFADFEVFEVSGPS